MRTLVLAVALLAGLGGLELGAHSQQITPTFKSAVDVVPISAIVRDHRGRMITTLTAADFEVLDKGERARIVDFQVDDTSPLTIAMVLDVSGSMRISPKMAFAREVLTRLGAELEDGRDEVSVFTFDATLHEQQPFTVHPASIDAALSTVEPFGITSLYDAIAETANRLGSRPRARRAIVVVTDGVDTGSVLTPGEVSALASSIEVPVYVVAAVPPIDRAMFIDRPASRNARASADLRDLALWTGGDLLWVSAGEEAVLRAGQILTELRHQYLITIDSAPDDAWRPLDVRVRDARLTVRARSGYFARDSRLSR